MGVYMKLLKVAAIAAIVFSGSAWQVLFLSTAAVAVTTVVAVIQRPEFRAEYLSVRWW